jgi:hypothetical protein
MATVCFCEVFKHIYGTTRCHKTTTDATAAENLSSIYSIVLFNCCHVAILNFACFFEDTLPDLSVSDASVTLTSQVRSPVLAAVTAK